jgi:4-diphosphocytidyl-2-C-methyl-D-erythritol kinase
MTRSLRLRAPAKINWTLEVLARRPDGYHEIRSVMQTIDMCDTVTLTHADGIALMVTGDAALLAAEPLERNLAHRAAEALSRHARVSRGVRIELAKHIPIAAGLGGGSSDAAAVLRGCNELWDLGLDDAELIEVAASIGSDVPFFVAGGTASVSGRGERVRALPDVGRVELVLAAPVNDVRGEKTASMYAALSPADFTDGEATLALEQLINDGHAISDDVLVNAFEGVLARLQPGVARGMEALRASGVRPHLAGSGPSYFFLRDVQSEGAIDGSFRRVRTLARKELPIEEL